MTAAADSAMVTGGSRGIGLGIAKMLARRGYGLTLSGRNAHHLEVAAAVLRKEGSPSVRFVATDMGFPSAAAALVAEHETAFGSMTALVLSAGVGTAGRIGDYPDERLDKTLEVNFSAPFRLIRQSLPMLRESASRDRRRGARIIALASMSGVHPEPSLAAYGASKAALLSLIDSLNLEESASGVTSTAIAPGYVDTAMSNWIHDKIRPCDMITVDDVVTVVEMLLSLSANAMISRIVVARAGTDGRHA